MKPGEIENKKVPVDKPLLIRCVTLLLFRILVLMMHVISIKDGLDSAQVYSAYAKLYMEGSRNIAQFKTIKSVASCSKTFFPVKSYDSKILNFNMSLFLLLGFYGIAIINFIVKSVVHLRLAICPQQLTPDICGRVERTMWDKVRDITFNIASFPCDMGVMSCIVGLYASKRGSLGLGCWQCYMEPTCVSVKQLDAILFMSSLSLNVNFILVLAIVFYKGFITYYLYTDPDKCDCHCMAPRCVTGCFVSLIITCVVMMPPLLVMKSTQTTGSITYIESLRNLLETIGLIIWIIGAIIIVILIPARKCLPFKKQWYAPLINEDERPKGLPFVC